MQFYKQRARLFIHQTMCPEEKTISTSKQGCEIAVSWLFLKDTETPLEVQKQSPEVFCKKRCSELSHFAKIQKRKD